MIVEDSETLTITVETSNPNDVIIGLSRAIVTIVDDDSKCIQSSILILHSIIFLVYYHFSSITCFSVVAPSITYFLLT